ncbi:hypothetical protein ACJMK2_012126 [Sinanodonta woodiana]|uniref:DNA excision repair protein ERCC-6-like n=1 Tax=Sinanodonta woodiana TaxID=1069815 RepID=A0ABD3V8C2_SINWO
MHLSDLCDNNSVDNQTNPSSKSSMKNEINEEDRQQFNMLIIKSKKKASEGHVREALELNKKALKIYSSEKLKKRILKMEAYLKEYGDSSSSEEEDNGMINLGDGFYIYKELYNGLYVHQKEGIKWLWTLYRRRKGGILGDDMGLGKTIQVIAFLSGMFDMDKIKSVLIVVPVSLMTNWEKEFTKWAPGICLTFYHGTSKKEKERALMKVQRRGGVCLTTYGTVVTSSEQLSQQDRKEFIWDYVILDEGHKIKNPTKTTKGVHAIGAKNRIILTGTPIQNNLRELWALFDFLHQGSLLGTARTFKMEYENPITRARERDATAGEKRLGMEMAESLKTIISPYFLRRTKMEVTAGVKTEPNDNDDNIADGLTETSLKMPSFTRKNDLIVWLSLTATQLKIYQDFLSLESVKELLMTNKSPLVALTVLKKICDHPRLLSTRACAQLGLEGDENIDDDMLEAPEGYESAANRIQHIDDDILTNHSGKMIFLVKLLDQVKSEGHRCLIFSQSRKMLDIIEKVIKNRGHKIMRLDGTVTQVADREQRIRKFQSDDSYSVFLLTTQVGGVGITLTAADRVIIFDPNWNPATDAQAVDRAFRIGQDKNVIIYRLITCGTVEEKIYRRQIFKDSITRQTTGGSKNPYSANYKTYKLVQQYKEKKMLITNLYIMNLIELFLLNKLHIYLNTSKKLIKAFITGFVWFVIFCSFMDFIQHRLMQLNIITCTLFIKNVESLVISVGSLMVSSESMNSRILQHRLFITFLPRQRQFLYSEHALFFLIVEKCLILLYLENCVIPGRISWELDETPYENLMNSFSCQPDILIDNNVVPCMDVTAWCFPTIPSLRMCTLIIQQWLVLIIAQTKYLLSSSTNGFLTSSLTISTLIIHHWLVLFMFKQALNQCQETWALIVVM